MLIGKTARESEHPRTREKVHSRLLVHAASARSFDRISQKLALRPLRSPEIFPRSVRFRGGVALTSRRLAVASRARRGRGLRSWTTKYSTREAARVYGSDALTPERAGGSRHCRSRLIFPVPCTRAAARGACPPLRVVRRELTRRGCEPNDVAARGWTSLSLDVRQ